MTNWTRKRSSVAEVLLCLVLAGLADYRLSVLLTREAGPFELVDKARMKASKRSSFAASLLSCPYCLGVWLALPLSLVAPRYPALILPWSAAGLQHLLQSLVDK